MRPATRKSSRRLHGRSSRGLFWPLLTGFLALSCVRSAPGESRAPGGGGLSAPRSQGGQGTGFFVGGGWLPPVEGNEPVVLEPTIEAHFLVGNLRATRDAAGRITAAQDLLPASKSTVATKLPARLGGGFVFFVMGQGTIVLRSDTWVGPLTAIARFEGAVERVEPGFTQLLLKAEDWFALDVKPGRLSVVSDLPPAASYENIAIIDGWFGAVEVPISGVLLTFDAGQTWVPTGIKETSRLRREGNKLLFDAGAQTYGMDARGMTTVREADQEERATPLEVSEEPVLDEFLASEWGKPSPFSDVLRAAVTRGTLIDDRHALVPDKFDLMHVDLSTGEVTERARGVFAAEQCSGVNLEGARGFVCFSSTDQTLLYRFDAASGVRLVQSLPGHRQVIGGENGAILVLGGCSDRAAAESLNVTRFCVRSKQGKSFEYRVEKVGKSHRPLALEDGSLALLEPPSGDDGALRTVSPSGVQKKLSLKWPVLVSETRALIKQGTWLGGFNEVEGKVAGWVMDDTTLVSVSIDRAGKVEVGDVKPAGTHPAVMGRFALLPAGDGTAWQSTDGGKSWSELELPMDERSLTPREDARVGVSPVGALLADWVRVGWQEGRSESTVIKEFPRLQVLPSPGGQRWQFTCRGPAEMGPSALPVGTALSVRRRPTSGVTMEEGRASWDPFWHLEPPARPQGGQTYQIGTDSEDVQTRGYLWSDRVWSASAFWQLYFADRFKVTSGIKRTRVSHAPFSDEGAASQAFGAVSSAYGVNWSAELEPSGDRGMLLIRTSGASRLFWFEEDRPLVALTGGEEVPRLAGLAELGSRVFAGWATTKEFGLMEVSGGRLVERARLPLGPNGAQLIPRLVRNNAKDTLGVWVRTQNGGWLVYPLDIAVDARKQVPEVRTLDPVALSARQLGVTPVACQHDDDGWVLVGRPEVNPHFDFSGPAEDLRVNLPEVHVLMRPEGVCLLGLAARADNMVNLQAKVPAAPGGTTLAVTDRRQGRRWGFTCDATRSIRPE